MHSRGNFRNDTAKAGVNIDLRSDHRRNDIEVLVNDRAGRLIAARFNGQYFSWLRLLNQTLDHIIGIIAVFVVALSGAHRFKFIRFI